MRRHLFAFAGLFAAGFLLPQGSRAELLMSAPEQLVAGSGSTLVLRFDSLGDRDASTQPVAMVAGNAIRIDLNDECTDISCDAVFERLFRVDLPALAEGDYAVTAYRGTGSDVVRGTFTLGVGAATVLPAVSPAEGFWTPVGQPGTGLHIQHRGGLLAVSQFDQVEPEGAQAQSQPRWRLDAAPLHGDTALVLLHEYAGGSCLGCVPFQAPTLSSRSMPGGSVPVRLHFASARTATAELADGTVVPLVNLPFGAAYVTPPFDTSEEAFGELVLPDLSGTWAINGVTRLVEFSPPTVEASEVRFESDALVPMIAIRCGDYGDGALPCRMTVQEDWSAPMEYGAALGDVTEDRIWFKDGQGGKFAAVRIPDSGPKDSTVMRPAAGFWSIPGQPGTGINLQQRGELLAAAQFDFIEGRSHWRLGVAPLDTTGAQAVLHSYSGGSCFGCAPHVVPTASSGGPTAAISFDSARRALVDLGDGNSIPLVNLSFGADYVDVQLPGEGDAVFGPLTLPDLSGTWAFEEVGGSGTAPAFVPLAGPEFVNGEVRFSRTDEGERFVLHCVAGTDTRPAGCELRAGNFALATPPPGYYPFARLGDVEKDRIRFVLGVEPGLAFYAVRIPAAD